MPKGIRTGESAARYAQYLLRRGIGCRDAYRQRRLAARQLHIERHGKKFATCKLCGWEYVTYIGARTLSRCIDCEIWAEQTKSSAYLIVSKAIQAGELPNPRSLQCTDCDAPASEYDHRDYSKPLEVDPTCRRCNARRGPAAPFNRFIQSCATA